MSIQELNEFLLSGWPLRVTIALAILAHAVLALHHVGNGRSAGKAIILGVRDLAGFVFAFTLRWAVPLLLFATIVLVVAAMH